MTAAATRKVGTASMAAAIIVLRTSTAHACPACFAAASERVLHAYFSSIVVLSALPLLLLAIGSAWLYRAAQRGGITPATRAEDSPWLPDGGAAETRTSLPPTRR